jgi:hypothetical protein
MCDVSCSMGIGVTAGVVGVMMTIICCKTLCEFMLECSKPDEPPVVTRTTAATITARPPTQSPTMVEMPILIRIYMPQMQPGAAQQQQQQPAKAEFEPLPV